METKLIKQNNVYVTVKRTIQNPKAKLDNDLGVVIAEIKERIEGEYKLEGVQISKVVRVLPGVMHKGYVLNVTFEVSDI